MVVTKMYQALTGGDSDAYLDTILPANRRVVNPINLLPALSIRPGLVGGVGINMDLGELMKVSVKEVNVKILEPGADYVLVQTRGKVRYPALGRELDFCDMHDVRHVDGQWYVDIYAPERQQRVDRILEKRQRQILEGSGQAASATGDDPLLSLFSGIGAGMEQVLNLCD